ncbi:uncharacterized protein PFL1_00508 [Pseudozyma flocculosa PF-1]|uniref:Related to NCA2 - control of mitochondrial synthesis of Atp6p and Atp8p n=1 Tax=Pseudozyma flocculosa TaxID=84751 RepID=A0A5C3ES99_9BASI|nr:uncharacterized protein PFL1_00508 [Pseudozyma flocculosa PF-1]EPQ32312.1 hypothetical protein PFL1_00508 [Pseudozyma flocculosa PF-1]SPO34730.1 related to NCA2 - control of mitochondrial synthesis of Atp6p and Atp8p [Pseudozyma flocculosa]
MGFKDSASSSTAASASSSFAADVLSRFAPQLERYEASLALPSTPASDDQADLGTASTANQTAQATTNAAVSKAAADIVRAIPITDKAAVPSHSALVRLLDRLDQACQGDTNTAFDQGPSPISQDNAETLRLVALARITYAAYALGLDALLQDASRINDEAWFWTEVEESAYRTLAHLVQTLPHRIAALVGATLELAAENASHTVRGTMDLARHSTSSDKRANKSRPSSERDVTLRNTLRTILATPNMVTGILFPYQFRSEGSITFALVQQQAQDKQRARDRAFGQARAAQAVDDDEDEATSIKARKRRAKALRSAALKLSPTHMIRHEARCKRQGLMHERDLLAAKMGELALQQAAPGDSDDDEVSLDSLSAKAVESRLLQDLGAKVHRLASALDHDDSSGTSTSDEIKIDIEAASSSADALTTALRTLLQETLPRSRDRTRLILSPARFGQPSPLTQNWPSLVVYPIAALAVSRYLNNNWDGIAAKMHEAKETVRGFLVGWVWEPCVQLLETVRHGRDDAGVIISRESLQSDLESLERMVSTFTREKYGITGAELDAVASRVRQGDLTYVLKIYEDEMRSPLKSAVKGSLIQSLLIQIQKAKVDLEVAMSGIDKLLKSQQLLFGAVGVAPALGVLYLSVQWLKGKVSGSGTKRGRRNAENLRVRAWEALRRIDHLLSSPSSTHSTLPPLNHGLMLLDLSLLRSSSYPLLLSASKGNKHLAKRLQRQFLHDVRDLESSNLPRARREQSERQEERGTSLVDQQPGLGYWSRRAAVERMWRSWGGIIHVGV